MASGGFMGKIFGSISKATSEEKEKTEAGTAVRSDDFHTYGCKRNIPL